MAATRSVVVVVLLAAMILPTVHCGSGSDTPLPGTMTPPGPTGPAFLTFTDFQLASVVIGQPDFTSGNPNQGGGPMGNTIASASGGASGSFYVADAVNHRILGFNTVPTTNNATADFVLGRFRLAKWRSARRRPHEPGRAH